MLTYLHPPLFVVIVTLTLNGWAVAACAEKVPFTRLRDEQSAYTLNSGVTEPRELFITDQSTFEQTWQALHRIRRPTPAIPAIDFETQDVILVALGQFSDGGHDVWIAGVEADHDRLYVYIVRQNLVEDCLKSTGFTQPVDIAIVPKLHKPVQFSTEFTVLDCAR